MTAELAANWYRTRRHYSSDLKPGRGGRHGLSLCSTEIMPVQVFDAEAHANFDKTYGLQPKEFNSLPLCKKCEKRFAKLGGAA